MIIGILCLLNVKKGAFTEEVAEKKFQAWLDEKAGKVSAKESPASSSSSRGNV